MWAEISPAMITKSVVVNFLVGSGSSVQNPLQIRVRAGVPGDSDSIDLTTSPPCEVTGRRHRVCPCRSSYFASPWRLLTLNLRRRSREAAIFSQSRDAIKLILSYVF